MNVVVLSVKIGMSRKITTSTYPFHSVEPISKSNYASLDTKCPNKKKRNSTNCNHQTISNLIEKNFTPETPVNNRMTKINQTETPDSTGTMAVKMALSAIE